MNTPAPWTGARIRALRHATGHSQSTFAIVLRIGRNTVYQWERGKYPIAGPTEVLLETWELYPELCPPRPPRPSARHARTK